VSLSTSYRMSAYALMLCGLFIIIKKTIIEPLLPLNIITYNVGTLAVVLGFMAFPAFYLFQREASGRLGQLGFLINWLALGLACGLEFAKNSIFPYLEPSVLQALLAGPTHLVLLSVGLIFLSGVILFGAATFRAGVYPRIAAVLYIVGFVPYSLSPLFPAVVVAIGQLLGAFSIIWFGYTLWMSTRKTETIQTGQMTPVHAEG